MLSSSVPLLNPCLSNFSIFPTIISMLLSLSPSSLYTLEKYLLHIFSMFQKKIYGTSDFFLDYGTFKTNFGEFSTTNKNVHTVTGGYITGIHQCCCYMYCTTHYTYVFVSNVCLCTASHFPTISFFKFYSLILS